MKYLSLLSVFFFLFAVSAEAQEDKQTKTPREQIVHDLGLDGLPVEQAEELPIETGAVVLPDVSAPIIGKPKTASEAIQDIFEPVTSIAVAKEISPKVVDIVVETKTPARKLTQKSAKKIAPFYLSAQDYLSLRGDGIAAQTILHYQVESGPATGSDLSTPREITLILGTDYAAIQVGKNTTLYDFKLNRILTIKPEYAMDGKVTGQVRFENTSLYAKAYRDISAVRGATQNGRLKQLDMGSGTTLDAFWIESAMSWSAAASGRDLTLDKTDKSLRVHRKGEVIFSAEFTDETYGMAGINKNSLLSFAHLEWPLHPSVLRALYAYDSPPKWFEMLSYGPTAPKGQKQVWTLVKRVDEEAAFPLPSNAIGTAQMQKVSPLVYLINEAVHNRALGGIKSVKQLSKSFKDKWDAEQYWQAWIVGQKYMAYSGGCKNPDDTTICKATANIEQNRKGDLPKRIQNYMTAVNSAGRPGLKGDAIEAIAPYLDKPETPAFIVRTAAMARAKMKKAQAETAGVTDMNPETLLQTALAKDPYDPNTYVGLAQVLAAKGAFEQSWDIYDALRAGIPTADTAALKINRLERNLRKTAPGYFLGE